MGNVTELNTYAKTAFECKEHVASSLSQMFVQLGIGRDEGIAVLNEVLALNEENTFDVDGPFETTGQACYVDMRGKFGMSRVQVQEVMEFMLEYECVAVIAPDFIGNKQQPTEGEPDDSIH